MVAGLLRWSRRKLGKAPCEALFRFLFACGTVGHQNMRAVGGKMRKQPFLVRFARVSDKQSARDPESKRLARLSTITTKVERETTDDR